MYKKYDIDSTDLSVEYLPPHLKDKSTNKCKVFGLTSQRFKDYEDLLSYFPKTYHTVEALKMFQMRSYDPLELLDNNNRVRMLKEHQEEHSVTTKSALSRATLINMKECLKQQWKELVEKEKELRDYLQGFREHLKIGADRLDRLRNEIRENRKLRKTKEKQIDHLMKENAKFRKILEDLNKDKQRLGVFKNYLQRVVDCPKSQFKNANEIVHHYEILNERRTILSNKFCVTSKIVADWFYKMLRLNKQAEAEIKNLKMQVYKLEQRYEIAKNKSTDKHNFYMYTLDKLRQGRQEFLVCREAIFSIYTMMSKDKPWEGKEPCSKDDFMGQLRCMSDVLKYLGKMKKKRRRLESGRQKKEEKRKVL